MPPIFHFCHKIKKNSEGRTKANLMPSPFLEWGHKNGNTHFYEVKIGYNISKFVSKFV